MFLLEKDLIAQPVLAQAISLITAEKPELGTRMIDTLSLLLAGISPSPRPNLSWEFSTLNKNSFPVEFTFASHDASVRYTSEVAGADVDPGDRLSQAKRQLAALGNDPWLTRIAHLDLVQTTKELQWGAWIGVRHRSDGERYKLYVEVPKAGSAYATGMVHAALGCEPLLPAKAASLIAIGQELASSRTEFYFKINHPGLAYWEVGYLLRRVGMESRQMDLLNLIEATRGYTLQAERSKLPKTTYGFSISTSSEGEPSIFSLFTFAGPFLGGDGAIRQRLLSLAEQRAWNFHTYAALTEPLIDWQHQNLHHNAIAFLIAPEGSPGLHISLSPPERREEESQQVPSYPFSQTFKAVESSQSNHNETFHQALKVSTSGVNAAIESATQFLINARTLDGWWKDFNLAPGCSDEWVTAYVGTAIAQLATPSTMAIALKAWHLLLQRQDTSPGWGYNTLVPRDADSTIWALQLANAIGCSNWDAAQQAREFLAQHLRPGGGIATYSTEHPIRRFIGAEEHISFQGWCGPHTCVTAAAAALPQLRFTACDFMRQTQQEDGYWKSYWWCEDEYATALAAEALANGIDVQDGDRVQRAVQWALSRIKRDGSVASAIQPSGAAFATAWVVRILLLGEPSRIAMPLAQTVQWLLNQQQPDGSWIASSGLRVPPPDLIDPATFQQRWMLHGLGEGGISLDQHRIFTTATILQALMKALQHLNGTQS
jgi:prenyltransferase beta subunit